MATTVNATNEYFESFIYAMITVNTITAIISVIFNFLIVCSFIKTSALRTPSFMLILGLALSDLGVGLVVQPTICKWLFTLLTTEYQASKKLLSFRVYHYSSNTLLSSSLLTMTFITVDRFLALRLRLSYHTLITTKKYCVVLLGLWVFSLSWTPWVYKVAFFIIIVIAIVTSLTHIILLILISRDIGNHSRKVHALQEAEQTPPTINMQRYKRSIHTLYYIMGAFALCYAPYWLYHIVRFAVQYDGIEMFYVNIALLTVIYINSSINPFIYCLRIHEIRRAVIKLFRIFSFD